ncbi:GNAT family N-acetyltransferase [Flagellimonas sp. 2504JD1-5]
MIFEITEKNQWDNVLLEIGQYDCYHTFEYHNIGINKGEKPVLLKYEHEGVVIALPLILRSIPDTEYFDFTSVYGYPGPIWKGDFKTEQYNSFYNSLNSYFRERKVVSVFSRLNPFISGQEELLKSIGQIDELGDVVNIDLTKESDIQRQSFSKTTKRYLNKTRRLCDVKITNNADDIETFIDLYYENMDRVNAKKSYYFDKNYFSQMARSQSFETDILYAIMKETNEIISAAMMFKTNNIVQYHISGTRNDYLHLTPIRLLLDETRISGTNEGYKYFNLGGGLGSEHDSLFQFKASFSKDFKKFKVWKYIVDEALYEELIIAKGVGQKSVNFFPVYRYTEEI